MPIRLSATLLRTPIVDANGVVTDPWAKYLQSREQSGAASQSSDADILAALGVPVADVAQQLDDLLVIEQLNASGDADAVHGASALTTIGVLPKVTAPGILGESAVTDDGTTVAALARQMAITGTRPAYKATATAGTQPGRWGCFAGDGSVYWSVNLSFDGTNWLLDDVTKTGTLVRLFGGAVETFSAASTAGANPAILTQTSYIDAAGNLNVIGGYLIAGVPGESATITYGSSLGGVIPAGLTLNTKTITFTKGIETAHT